MKKVITFFLLIVCIKTAYSQDEVTIVSDAATREALVSLHMTQYENFTMMEKDERLIMEKETLIKEYTEKINAIETTLYGSLSIVQSYISEARAVQRIATRVEKIITRTGEVCNIIAEDPELIIAGLGSSVTDRIRQRTVDLGEYLIMATTGGEYNLMNNKDRIKIIYHVDVELRVLYAQLGVLKSNLLVAKKQGLFRYFFPQFFQWQSRLERNAEIAQEILDDFEL